MNKLILTAVLSTMVVAVNAATYTVPGWADPWLANGGVDPAYGGEPADYPFAKPDNTPYATPDSSPIPFGSVSPGNSINWTAWGEVGHPGEPAGPDGDTSQPNYSRVNGALNGIPDFSAPINSLIGVFTGPGFAEVFLMGSSGSKIVPVGADALYMGTMDAYGWGNNIGAFTVNASVPDGGSTLALLGGAMAVLSGMARRFRS
jgi:hypothetical protein